MENPFLYIVPREDEKIVNMQETLESLRKSINLVLKQGMIVALIGDYGSGKTLLIKELKKHLTSKKIELIEVKIGQDIINIVYSLKEKRKEIIAIIDQVDLLAGMDKEYLKNFLNTVRAKSMEGITFVFTMNKHTLKDLSELDKLFGNMVRKIEIPSISYKDAKKLITSRLNEVRTTKIDSLEPFDEEEIKSIWEKSHGNPRLILLLCSSMYDKKMKFK